MPLGVRPARKSGPLLVTEGREPLWEELTMRASAAWFSLLGVAWGLLTVGCAHAPSHRCRNEPADEFIVDPSSALQVPRVDLPAELQVALAGWRAFAPSFAWKIWSPRLSPHQQSPLACTLVARRDGSHEVRRLIPGERGDPANEALPPSVPLSLFEEFGFGVISGHLAVAGGHVVVLERENEADLVCWLGADGGKPQVLEVPSPWTNALLVVEGRLWLGCGLDSPDYLCQDAGMIVEYTLRPDGWSMVRKQDVEQAVLAMAEDEDGSVLVVCGGAISLFDAQFRRRVLYGVVGLVELRRATWKGAGAASVCRVGGSIFVGTPIGFAVLSPLGGLGKGLYHEVFMVPPELAPLALETGAFASECTVGFEAAP